MSQHETITKKRVEQERGWLIAKLLLSTLLLTGVIVNMIIDEQAGWGLKFFGIFFFSFIFALITVSQVRNYKKYVARYNEHN